LGVNGGAADIRNAWKCGSGPRLSSPRLLAIGATAIWKGSIPPPPARTQQARVAFYAIRGTVGWIKDRDTVVLTVSTG